MAVIGRKAQRVHRIRPTVTILSAAVLAALPSAGISAAQGDPNALWDIVNGSCVPDQ
ncbi:MAG: hypothetical protein QOK02_1001, partial [Mycobacterium sp.]|nr:hypothetical protein [Mycobacterium sp.]